VLSTSDRTNIGLGLSVPSEAEKLGFEPIGISDMILQFRRELGQHKNGSVVSKL